MREQLQLLTQTPLLKQKKKEKSKKEKRKKEKRKGGEVQKAVPEKVQKPAPEKVHKRSSSSKSSRLVNTHLRSCLFLVCILYFCKSKYKPFCDQETRGEQRVQV